MTGLEGVVCLPIPQVSEQRSVRVWCPAAQALVEMKGTVEARCGLETLRVDRCVNQVLGCSCLKDWRKRGYCMVGKELTANKW
jgi:hypothetical protein